MNYSNRKPDPLTTDRPPQILYETFEEFAAAIEQEFTVYSAIDPDLYQAAVTLRSDLEQTPGGESYEPIAEFLGWNIRESQPGFSSRRTFFAGLLHCESGLPWQAKLSYQLWDGSKGKYGKPYFAPKGGGSKLYFPPVPASIRRKIGDRYKINVPLDGEFWPWLLLNYPEVPIVVTEGAKKALAALSYGVVAVSLYGCNSGYRKVGEGQYELIEDLRALAQVPRQFILAFDRDISRATQGRVKDALEKTAALLQECGSVVKVADWKAVGGKIPKGLDDLIVDRGVKAFETAIDRAKLVPKVEKAKSKSAPEQSEEQLMEATSIQWTPGMYLLSRIARILGQQQDCYITVLGQVYEWTGKYYKRQEEGELRCKIQAAFESYCYESKEMLVFPFAKTIHVTEALNYLKVKTFVQPEKITKTGICLKNGILQIQWDESDDRLEFLGFELVPHDKKYYFLSCSEVEYDPAVASDDCDRLLEAIPTDQRQTWLEHQSLNFDFVRTAARFGRPRAGLHEGTGSNGKDSCRQAIADIFPAMGAFTFGDFQQYEDGRPFAIASLPKFTLSWSSENTSKVKLENLKSLQNAISANGNLRSEFKNQNPIDYQPDCLFHFNVNKAPITDAADFIRSRFVIYTYPYTYSSSGAPGTLEADERYAYDHPWRIKNVSSALLNRLCQAFTKAWERGGVDYSPCEARLKEWAADRNHILQFCESAGLVAASATDSIEIAELWSQLEDWYQENDYLSLVNSGDRNWASDPSQFDLLVKKSADLFPRLQALFPNLKKRKDSKTRRSIVTGLKVQTKDDRRMVEGRSKDELNHPSGVQTQEIEAFDSLSKDAKDDSLLNQTTELNSSNIYNSRERNNRSIDQIAYKEKEKVEKDVSHPSPQSQNAGGERVRGAEGQSKTSFTSPSHGSNHPSIAPTSTLKTGDRVSTPLGEGIIDRPVKYDSRIPVDQRVDRWHVTLSNGMAAMFQAIELAPMDIPSKT